MQEEGVNVKIPMKTFHALEKVSYLWLKQRTVPGETRKTSPSAYFQNPLPSDVEAVTQTAFNTNSFRLSDVSVPVQEYKRYLFSFSEFLQTVRETSTCWRLTRMTMRLNADMETHQIMSVTPAPQHLSSASYQLVSCHCEASKRIILSVRQIILTSCLCYVVF